MYDPCGYTCTALLYCDKGIELQGTPWRVSDPSKFSKARAAKEKEIEKEMEKLKEKEQ